MEKVKPWLGEPQNTIAVLQKYGFVFQKKYGQNFLIDPHVLDKIVAAAGIGPDDFVVEIGPGIGTLTQYLAYAARSVCAVEIDKNLIPILEDTLSDYDNVEVINNDVLKVDLAALAKEKNNGRPIKVVANLPYYITTPIIMGLFENHVPVDSITVMVQKEVADRMQTGPGSKDYGALSLAVQYYAEPYIVANVPPNCFMPRPKVGSAVIRLTRHEVMPVETKDEKLMFSIIRASFNQRRKTLANGLKNSELLHFSKEEIEAAITACGWPLTIRGEALNLQEFAGELPADYEQLLALPGIGSYTAGAIASIAYQICVPAVDGNVLRVVSRLTASRDDILKQSVKKRMEQLVGAVIPAERPGAFNQALMELGAMVCVPNGMARCDGCPLRELCEARKQGIVMELPRKTPKKARRLEDRTVLVVRDGDKVAIHRRPGKGLLAGMYEFPNVEGFLTDDEVLAFLKGRKLSPIRIQKLEPSKHIFSHIEWHMIGYVVRVEELEEMDASDWIFIEPQDTGRDYPIPAAFGAYTKYLNIKLGLDNN